MQSHAYSLEGDLVIRKATRRILPILLLCYFAAFLDRVNIGFAAKSMNADLGFTASQFGFGAGIFFLGYVVCELPSNLLLVRFGARAWIARILVSWGLLSALTAFVWNVPSFYTVRTLLGAAEAGLFPGIIYYLTLWFPKASRAKMFALFNIAVPFSSMIGAPISGLIIQHMHGLFGLAGWKWMFLIEGVPAILAGIAVFALLPNTPDDARFLSVQEKTWLNTRLRLEKDEQEQAQRFTVRQALADLRVLLTCAIAVGLVMGTTGIAIWMPQIVNTFGTSTVQTGFIVAIPALFMAISMVLVGRHADKTGERVWHAAGPFFVSAVGFVIAGLAHDPLIELAGLTIGAAGIGGASPNIWVFPTTLLTGAAAAAGVALINSVGSTGGFFGPTVIGLLRDLTGGFGGALLALAGVMALTAVCILILGRSMRDLLTQQTRRTHSTMPLTDDSTR